MSLQQKCTELISQQHADHPGLTTLGEGDANSTVGGSNIDTPRPSVPPGGTKLKLNFSAAANGNNGVASGGD